MSRIHVAIFFLLLVITAFLALIWRCFYLQYYKGPYYNNISIEQQKAFVNWQPERGTILDDRGKVLAASNRLSTIFADPNIISDVKETSSKLAEVVNIGAHEICKLIVESKNPHYVKIMSDATPMQCDAARKIHGINVTTEWQRQYPMGNLVASLVGFTGKENKGLEGIELKYDSQLRGSPVQNIFLVDVGRRPIRLQEQNGILADGVGLILTIDTTIQQFVRDELFKQYKEYQAESAVAVVAEPKTGAILAMVSLPDFDPSNLTGQDPNNFKTRAITDWYEPGSIIKPFVAAIAINAGVVNKTEKIFCENGHYSGRGFGSISEYRNGFGDLTLREILMKSSNIGMAKIGQRLEQFDRKKLHDGLVLFGFGSPTGIELPGEVEGLLRPAREWTGYSFTRIPFGQEICVTAMQLVRAFCCLANGGRVVNPYIVKAIVDNNGQIVQSKHQVPPIEYIVKREAADWIVKECLTAVINEGTGTKAKLDDWQVFGKTGTANIAKSDGKGYSDEDYIASFICGAPVENPKIVVLISIRKPNKKLDKGYTGGTVAAPVGGAIVKKTLTYLEDRQSISVHNLPSKLD